MFSDFLKQRISQRKETCNSFFDQLKSDISIMFLPPGLYYYNEVAGDVIPDMWTRYLVNDDTRKDLYEFYLPEVDEFISKYEKLFMDTIDKYPTPEKAFELFVDRFMKATFYQTESFENNLLNEDHLNLDDDEHIFLPNVRHNLKKEDCRHFQAQYVYVPHMLQCYFYLKTAQLWFANLTKRSDFFSLYTIFIHSMYMRPIITIGCDLLKMSHHQPIIIQNEMMRFCVAYRRKIYYCYHDIRLCFSVWFLILCSQCDGKLIIEGDLFDITKHIPKELLYETGLISIDEYEGEIEGESEEDDDITFTTVDMASFLQSNKMIDEDESMKYNPISMTGRIHPTLKFVEDGMKLTTALETQEQHRNGFEPAQINDIYEMRKQRQRTHQEPLSILRSNDAMFQHPDHPYHPQSHPNLGQDIEE